MSEMNPVQPYMALQTKNYKKKIENRFGISHFYEFSLQESQNRAVQAVPDGTVDLLFGITPKRVYTSIGGTVLEAKKWNMEQGQKFFGVCFHPGGCVLPKDIQIQDVIDADIEIDGDLFGDGLTEKLISGKTLPQKAKIFMESYQTLLKKQDRFDGTRELERYVRNRIMEEKGNISISELSEETGYSACYIRRIFGNIHGISPKVFEKFIRFQYLLNTIEGEKENPDLDETAMKCGYYDQSHMIKDFKCYTGTTPEAFLHLAGSKIRK